MVWIPNLKFGKFTETAKAMPRLNEHGIVEKQDVACDDVPTVGDSDEEQTDERP